MKKKALSILFISLLSLSLVGCESKSFTELTEKSTKTSAKEEEDKEEKTEKKKKKKESNTEDSKEEKASNKKKENSKKKQEVEEEEEKLEDTYLEEEYEEYEEEEAEEDFEEEEEPQKESKKSKQKDKETNNHASVSDDWKDLEFALDGEVFSLPFAYSDLESLGYSFDIEDYTDDEDFSLEPNEYTMSGVDLHSKEYGDDYNSFALRVRFVNLSEEPQKLKDCDICSIEIDRTFGDKLCENYASLDIAGGLTWGATEEDVFSVFGEPYHEYEGSYYTAYTFQFREEDYRTKEVTVYISPDNGLNSIEMEYR